MRFKFPISRRERFHIAAPSAFLTLIIALSSHSAFGQRDDSVPSELRVAIERIEEMAALELAKENLGSVTIGVVSGADLIWTRSYGFADMEEKVMATKDSVYRIGSITKQFTGFMLNSARDHLTSGYGIGFGVSRFEDLVIYGHGGSVAGYRAAARFDRASKAGVIVLRNVGGKFNVSDLARRALAEVAAAKSEVD